MQKNIVVGIDLAGVATNPTGWALLKNNTISSNQLYHDEEILKHSTDCKPHLIAIDAPLSLPKKGTMRKSDRKMHKLGYPVFPPHFPAMEKLTLRAIKITEEITRRGFNVIEVHPTSSRKALKAATAALTGHLHLQGKTELIGDEEEYIVVPTENDWRRLLL